MANEARSGRGVVNNDESSSSKEKKITTGLSTPDASSLRRSGREMLSKENLGVRKSERLEKRSPTTSPVNGKSERVEKKCTPSPLRRSERGKNNSYPSSESKNSDKSLSSSSMKRKKMKKQKSVKQLTLETGEASKNEQRGLNPMRMRRKTGNLRAFRSIFNKFNVKTADCGGKKDREPKFSPADGSKSEDEVNVVDECNERNMEATMVGECNERSMEATMVDECNEKSVDTTSSNLSSSGREEADEIEDGGCDSDQMGSPRSSECEMPYDAVTIESNEERGEILVDCFLTDILKEPGLVDSSSRRTTEGQICLKSTPEIIPSRRKMNTLNVDCESFGVDASKDICASSADAISSLPSECTRSGSFKRQRVDHDSIRQEFSHNNTNLNAESVVASSTKQKESHLQTGADDNTCDRCKLGGKLLFCDGRGCQRSYHLSCLDPPMDDVPLGVWYCFLCVKKKLELGVHSVSEGVESIWDAKEVEIDGQRKQKEFFVKYKGLAHIHNHWVPESKLLLDAPSLVAKFNRTNQVARWKKEWTVPHRLLQKRMLMSNEERDLYLSEHAGDKLDCHHEWLVKWRGLGYEHATWELENAPLFNSRDVQGLIRDYDNRCNKVPGSEKCSYVKLSQVRSSAYANNVEYINKLCDFLHRDQNAVFIDEQERITKMIQLIQAFHSVSNTCCPFLIISTSAALGCWDDEFLRLAPSVNVVVYNGNKDLRRSIRKLEFHNERGCVIFQALITTLAILTEDLDVLKSIRWELILIDECQNVRFSSHCSDIKLLDAKMRLLLVSSQLKESASEYQNLLSLLDSCGDSNLTYSSDSVSNLKEKLSKYIIHGKLESSRSEYWVPVRISNVQLEEYCAALISKSEFLCSPLNLDNGRVLKDVLKSNRKCCDHPFLVNKDLAKLLRDKLSLEPIDFLGVDIKASGKFHLLQMMLSEIKQRGLRVLILFQSMGASGSKSNTIGDLLEDFMRQKYGLDSYERLEGIVPHSSKKQEILSNFNNRERGRFVFLIDTRACLSSVKLSSVDGVIIFGSDWNPASDVRSLRRVTFDSPFDQIPIFRLYSSNTLEEKVLILAKQGKIFNSLENMTWSTCHVLLKWGVSHQFQNLDKFHSGNVTASRTNIFSEESFWEDVMQEFSHILSNGKVSGSRSSSIILNVQQVGAAYHADSSLLGELQNEIVDEGQPCLFWTKLLEGRYPRWKYISTSSQRTRKRAQFFDGSSKSQEFESDEVVKKRKKVVNSSVELPSVKFVSEGKKVAGHKERAFGTSVDNQFHSSPRSTYGVNEEIPSNSGSTSPCLGNLKIPEADIFVSEERKKLLNEQKSLHLLLKPDMLKLCKILKLSDDVQNWVEKFLEYVLNNHPVAREPATSLQSFQMSLCWTVASWLKLKIDFKESLDQANQHLNFNCDKDDAELVYYMLRCLKRLFSDHVKGNSSNVSNKQKLRVPVEDSLINQESSDKMVPSQSSLALDFKLAEIDVEKIIIKIKKKYQKLLNKLLQKLLELKNEVKQTFEIEKEELERKKGARISVIRSCFENNPARRTDQLKLVDSAFAKEIEELEQEKDKRLKSLEEEEQTTRNKMQEKETMIVEGVKTWAYAELLGKPHGGIVYLLGCSQTKKPVRDQDGPANINPRSDNILDNHRPDKVLCKVGVGVGLSAASEAVVDTVPSEAVISSHSVSRAPQDQAISGNEELDNLASDQEHVTSLSPHSEEQIPERHKSVSLGNNAHKVVSTKSLCQEQSHDEATLIVPNGEVLLEIPENVRSSNDNDQEFQPLSLPCSEQNHDEIASRTFDSEVSLGSQATACSNDGEDNLVTAHLPSPEEQNCALNEAEEVLLGVPVTIGSSDHLQRFVSVDQPSSQKQIPDTDVVQMTDREMQLGVPETVCSSDSLVNVICVNQESSEEQIAERATLSVPDEENGEMCIVTSNGIDVNEQDGISASNLGEMCTVASNGTIDVNERDGRAASNHNSLRLEPSLVNSSRVQPATSLAQGDPMPINQAQQDEHSLEPQTVEAALSRHLDQVAQIFEPGMQMNLPPCSNAPDLPLFDGTNQLSNIGHTTNQGYQASVELSGNPLELSNQAGTQLQPNSESADVSHASVRLVENLPQLSNQLPPVTSSSPNLPMDIATVTTGLQFSDFRVPFVASEFNNGHIQSASASAVPSWAPPPLHPDPLETEVQRLSKEIEKFSQIHEETKLRLKSDRDNEIAQLVRKYEIKEQEIEAEFLFKKKELDENKNKVMNNKYLADAFRSKCMEARTQTRSAVQQDSSGFTQLRYLQQALQQQNAQRATVVASSSLASSPAANLQTTQPASGVGERVSRSHLGSYSIPNPPTRPPPQTHTLPTRPPPQTQNLPTRPQAQTQNPPTRPAPETTAPPTRPPTQTNTPPTRPPTHTHTPPARPPTQTHTPPARPPTQTNTPPTRPPTQTNTPPARPPQINTPPTRPPHINTPPTRPPQINTSSPGLFQGAGSIRAPAPHLGRFRPPTSTASLPPHPTPSLQPHPSVMPMQQSNNMASATNVLPTLPPQQPLNTSQPDAANSEDRLQTALGGLPDSVPNGQLNSSAPGPMQVNPVSTDSSANVVYLSDDD